MKILGVILILVGALMLAYPIITYTEEETLVDVGPVEVTAENQESIPLPPILGGAAIVAGIALLVVTGRSRSVV